MGLLKIGNAQFIEICLQVAVPPPPKKKKILWGVAQSFHKVLYLEMIHLNIPSLIAKNSVLQTIWDE